MAGLIRREDIDELKARVRIDEIVSDYVALKPAGMDSMKGLCPFHDEKTPSFNIRPSIGRWHCFGCGEGGDAFEFIERVENISFVEAVELLARKYGVELRYEEGNRQERPKGPLRQRLVDAHATAVEFYQNQLQTSEAAAGRDMLEQRGFDGDAIRRYGVGYSPNSWDALVSVLRSRGFRDEEILAAGLATQGNRGLYDRFRGRLMWPILSITGDPIGFGARRLAEDDQGPKYLNTPETVIYKKSQVLYGLNLAKKDIVAQRQIVVVEGYTDVMAAHLAGVNTAVATCGTAFGPEHVKIVRRLLGDGANPAAGVMLTNGRAYGGEVIFTFDGDAAGQKAALRAFQEDQQFAAQTFVSIAPDGMDPCELRMERGDAAVVEVIQRRRPLFEFAIRSVLAGRPLGTAEGRTTGLRAAAPIVASIRDRVLRGEYTRLLAGWLGMDETTVRTAVRGAGRAPAPRQAEQEVREAPALAPRASLRDPVERLERAALEIFLQFPGYAYMEGMDGLGADSFIVPIHRRVHEAVRAAGGVSAFVARYSELTERGMDPSAAEREASQWFVGAVSSNGDDVVARAVAQLAVEPLAESRADRLQAYIHGIAGSVMRQALTRQIADMRSHLQRLDPASEEASKVLAAILELENARRAYDSTT